MEYQKFNSDYIVKRDLTIIEIPVYGNGSTHAGENAAIQCNW